MAQELRSLTAHFERFVQIQDAFIAQAKEDELDAHQALGVEMETLYKNVSAELHRLTDINGNDENISEQSVARSTIQQELRLERLTVPTFDGSLGDWLAFKDAFETLVHKHEYPEAYKLGKLRAAAKGVALVGGTYSGGYQEVWEAEKAVLDYCVVYLLT